MSSVGYTRSGDSYDAALANVEEKHERTVSKMKEDEEETLAEAKKEYQERLKRLREEANEEVRKLKEDTYDSHGRRFANLERDNLQEQQRIKDSYEAALTKAEKSRKEQEQNFEGKIDDALNEANDRNRSQMESQKKEYTRLAQEQRREAQDAKKVYETEIAKEKVRSQMSTERQVADSNAATNKALSNHSAMYEEYMKENSRNQKVALAQKDEEIRELKNTADPTKISPEAKRKIERSYQQRYDADLQNEREVNAATVAAMRDRDQKYQQSMREDYAKKYEELSKDLRANHLVEKQTLVKGYRELEDRSNNANYQAQQKTADQSTRTYQKHASELSLLGQRNQEQLREQRDSLMEQRFKEQEDRELKFQEIEREMAFKLNDTRREFEKKLADQKEAHETEMANQKFEFDKKLQDQQRTAKRLYEEKVRAYELQIKTMESQQKEQNRLLTEHYEDQLDSMKRTNARITQAKS